MRNHLIHRALLLTVILFISGCAGTAESLRSGAAGTTTFKVARPLPEVFNIIKEEALGCNPGAVTSNVTVVIFGTVPVPSTTSITWYVNPVLSLDRERAEIQFFNRNGGFENHLMVIDLRALQSNETQVTTYYKFSAWRSAAENVEGWVKGTSHRCWVKS